jgi:hypothetical protein
LRASWKLHPKIVLRSRRFDLAAAEPLASNLQKLPVVFGPYQLLTSEPPVRHRLMPFDAKSPFFSRRFDRVVTNRGGNFPRELSDQIFILPYGIVHVEFSERANLDPA